MYVHSVKLVNFKSFGDYNENEIILEPKVTAIIGKNESGKSNILDGISRISFFKSNAEAFSSEVVNRNSDSNIENSYILVLKPTINDCEKGIKSDAQVIITKNHCMVTGALFDYYNDNIFPAFRSVALFLNEIGRNPFQLKDQEYKKYSSYIADFEKTEQLDTYQEMLALDFLHNQVSKLSGEQRQNYKEVLEVARNAWFNFMCLFPTFFYRKADKQLKSTYKLDEIEKELSNPLTAPNSLLFDFVKLIGISTDDFLLAARSGVSGKQETLRRRINKLVDTKINSTFADFYRTETISLYVGFNSNMISFSVQSEDGEALLLSERSNGLKWYLETFIDAKANNIVGRNSIYLLDEPGTSLHVNAQKKLLSLFKHLSEQENQVLYTTHSPYMLDLENEGVHRIRAVVKDMNGLSYIYKTAYDSRIAPETQEDTLAPIINAIGMNLNDTFGPALDKINIVTEGMSDYIYLCTMAKVLGIDPSRYTIIPAVGASNCVKICSILHGWGCKYMALFDYDKAGVETGGEYLRKEMMFDYKKHYCYLIDVSQQEIDDKSYKTNPFMIEDVITRNDINEFCKLTNTATTIGKPLMAKLMSNAIESGVYQVSDACIDNFQNLFNRIDSYFK